jgi:hypothetical protein
MATKTKSKSASKAASKNGGEPKAPAKGPQKAALSIPELQVQRVVLHIEGTSPLISHRFAAKAKRAMLDKQMKRASKGKEAKDPEKDYEESLYPLEDGKGYGFPAVAFKAAAVRAGTYSDLTMTFLRGAFHTVGELVPIIGSPQPREDMVRLNGQTADIRYRAEFPDWEARVPVDLNVTALSIEQLVSLFRTAGFAVGVGEWRPERNVQFDLFSVDGVEVAG